MDILGADARALAAPEGVCAAGERAVQEAGLGPTVRKLIARLKALVDWAGTAFTLIGWFSGTAWITGIGVAVGGAIWAIIIGVPEPIAIMAGYCTLAGGVVLSLSPLAYRAFSRMAAAPIPQASAVPQKPNAAVWQHVPKFTLYQAA
jgi:hypothetical protein